MLIIIIITKVWNKNFELQIPTEQQHFKFLFTFKLFEKLIREMKFSMKN